MDFSGTFRYIQRAAIGIAACFILTTTAATTAAAATRTWDGGSLLNNNWQTLENWEGDVAPMAGDDLVFGGHERHRGAAALRQAPDAPPAWR
jgi:hypothetical protein